LVSTQATRRDAKNWNVPEPVSRPSPNPDAVPVLAPPPVLAPRGRSNVRCLVAAAPLPPAAGLSGYAPGREQFRAWYEAEFCGLHALHIDAAKSTAVVCFPTKNAREAHELAARHAVPNSTTGLGGPDQT
jgi:hypothetical protein